MILKKSSGNPLAKRVAAIHFIQIALTVPLDMFTNSSKKQFLCFSLFICFCFDQSEVWHLGECFLAESVYFVMVMPR